MTTFNRMLRIRRQQRCGVGNGTSNGSDNLGIDNIGGVGLGSGGGGEVGGGGVVAGDGLGANSAAGSLSIASSSSVGGSSNSIGIGVGGGGGGGGGSAELLYPSSSSSSSSSASGQASSACSHSGSSSSVSGGSAAPLNPTRRCGTQTDNINRGGNNYFLGGSAPAAVVAAAATAAAIVYSAGNSRSGSGSNSGGFLRGHTKTFLFQTVHAKAAKTGSGVSAVAGESSAIIKMDEEDSMQTFLSSSDADDEPIKQLPKEILLRIFSYLDVVSLCRCAQ
ncbi:unnamed protein product, partial [Ceratitis capitata]